MMIRLRPCLSKVGYLSNRKDNGIKANCTHGLLHFPTNEGYPGPQAESWIGDRQTRRRGVMLDGRPQQRLEWQRRRHVPVSHC